MGLTVACLDVWADAVRQEVQRVAPPDWTLRFAQSYESAHQQAVAADADALLPGFAPVDEALLAAAPRVRWVHKWGIGIDSIDLAALRRRGIGLAITTGANSQPVAEMALALILAVNRRIPYVNRVMRLGQWPTPEMRQTCYQIQGKTIGLLGFGQIGQRLAQLLLGFEVRILYEDLQPADAALEQRLRAQRVSREQLLADSDIVSLHAPLTDATRHVINARTLAAMKPGAILINTSRGGLIDEAALYAALLSGHLRGAGLDAFDPEPPSVNNPLLQLEQVVLTPHAGGGVFDNVEHVARHALGNIARWARGEPVAERDLILAPASTPNPTGAT
ncbi:MAG: 2-hydroxyacid dehydrogenase [Betaproteobacteria bacterium]